jgi:hypothetical protein
MTQNYRDFPLGKSPARLNRDKGRFNPVRK